MVKLTDLCKSYTAGDNTVQALKGVSLQFRKGEFVAILGPSGCGKTTLLNLIGGLDRYDSGDISVDGKSTKHFKASDWDSYRNHSVGFVFQSYNLIGHQTILANVELALTLAGVSRSERRRRAVEALKKVGLGKELKKKPNQLSGGQMQRVAIARALINDPEILLADEPTGALDSETSRQVMELLKEVAKDRLVIMVTHNGELAEEYSTRIIRFLDGVVIDDSNPCLVAEYSTEKEKTEREKKKKKPSMSFKTAFMLSLNNLLTKKGRTALTSFAGSIGIIGIALILSLSSGFQGYIDRVQEETLSTYPLTINSATMGGGVAAMMFAESEENAKPENNKPDTVYSSTMMATLYNSMKNDIHVNDLKGFKEFIESDDCKIKDVSTVQYDYGLTLNFYSADTSKGPVKADVLEILDEIYLAMTDGKVSYTDAMASMSGMMGGGLDALTSTMNMNMWCQLIDNQELLDSQYDVLAGHWPKEYNEVVLCVSDSNQINELVEFAMNLRTREELEETLDLMFGEDDVPFERKAYTYEYLLNELRFKLVLNSDLYKESAGGVWYDNSADKAFLTDLVNKGAEIKICGIIRPSKDSVAQSMSGVLGYSDKLVEYIIAETEKSGVVKAQKENKEINVLTGLAFGEELPQKPEQGGLVTDALGKDWEAFMGELYATNPELAAKFGELMQNTMSSMMGGMAGAEVNKKTTYEDNLTTFGSVDFSKPANINIYPSDFAAKDTVSKEIERFNADKEEKDTIMYTDLLDLMLSSISTIIDAISYVLIAFVSISLVVSSIMIGVITYISVLERTKEIGILRAVGASKRDISRVFNAETFIVGLIAGLLGIGVTVLLNIPINIIINNIAEIGNIAALPVGGAVILVAISVVLTLIAGLIPSRIAAKKDPVEALRTE